MNISAEKAKKIYRHLIKYWWIYGILISVFYLLMFWIFKGNTMVIKDITAAIIIGFLQGGILIRWMANYHLGELERKEKGEDSN